MVQRLLSHTTLMMTNRYGQAIRCRVVIEYIIGIHHRITLNSKYHKTVLMVLIDGLYMLRFYSVSIPASA